MDLDYIVIPALIVMIGILIAWLSIRLVLSLRRKNYSGWRKFTTTIDGKQIPPPPPKFGGVIMPSAADSKPWWRCESGLITYSARI